MCSPSERCLPYDPLLLLFPHPQICAKDITGAPRSTQEGPFCVFPHRRVPDFLSAVVPLLPHPQIRAEDITGAPRSTQEGPFCVFTISNGNPSVRWVVSDATCSGATGQKACWGRSKVLRLNKRHCELQCVVDKLHSVTAAVLECESLCRGMYCRPRRCMPHLFGRIVCPVCLAAHGHLIGASSYAVLQALPAL